MSVILKCRVKDKGDITWPPIGEPDFPEADDPRVALREWLRTAITEAAQDTRVALGTGDHTRVHVGVTFRPDIMVDA